MLEAFHKFLSDKCGLHGGERVLLAVSGGIDSMAMAHLFRLAGLAHGMAHCNFQLRGQASDMDEQMVREYAGAHQIPLHCIAFPTQSIAAQEKESIQVTARRLRYEWLETIRREEGYDLVATAHHMDDAAETMLYNLSKGCGIRGLHGIAERRGHVIRPLLFSTRAEIEQWAASQGFTWRDDASNAETHYARNKIRLLAIPALREINPQWERTMAANTQRFRDAEALYEYAVADIARLVKRENADGSMDILLHELRAFPAPVTVLYELLRPFGFVPEQARVILDSGARQPGALFHSPGYRLLLDRGEAHIQPLSKHMAGVIEVELLSHSVAVPEGSFEISPHTGNPDVILADPHTAMLDAGALTWPLRIRRWQAGDSFHPLGMKGRSKKLQDFFTDEKLSRFDKEKVWIVETAEGEICWVAGYRIDDRFRITPQTSRYLVLKYRKNEASL